ncbi:MAG: LON peptidase substrate-binding domain-containing protein [Siculibacillus sp.]|nr:LON peptidase substrate-binding domain-containing protein [Siculibacillus sp.]
MTRAGNRSYEGPDDLPAVIPLFPLTGALLLPRRALPLNVFEPRYLAMVDAALAGDRLIGLIQPRIDRSIGERERRPPLERIGCLGRITQFAETGDGRLIITLIGVTRFAIAEELSTTTPYRQARPDFGDFGEDFRTGLGEDAVDRASLLATLRAHLDANEMAVEWSHFESASNETLVDGLAMMSPCGPREKQALLETPDLATRAALLVAITERSLAEKRDGPKPLQ